jgi:alpha-glucoside transport system substrate-binding protein
MTRRRLSRLALCAAVAGLLGASACSSTPQYDTVTIMVPWSDTEFADFYSVVQSFETLHPSIHVAFQATRAQREQLDEAVRANQPPDLAVLPSIGTVEEYIHPGSGETGLAPLPDIEPAGFVAPFNKLMNFDNGVYAVPIKADVKSLLWYPSQDEPPPTSPSALAAYSEDRPGLWCLGLASGPTSGWPGADAIADLLLEQGGVEVYKGLLAGTTKWDGAQVQQAWNTWGEFIRNSKPGDALAVPYQDASKGMSTGKCSVEHGALAAMGFPSTPPVDRSYDFVQPEDTPLQVSADFLGMFDTHNPGAVQLLDYLADPKTQQMWVQIPGADAFSAEGAVKADVYPSAVQKRIAGLLQPTAGRTLCFSLADAMQPDVAAAFYRAVLNFAGSPGSAQLLTSNLEDLDNVQKNAAAGKPTAELANRLCS